MVVDVERIKTSQPSDILASYPLDKMRPWSLRSHGKMCALGVLYNLGTGSWEKVEYPSHSIEETCNLSVADQIQHDWDLSYYQQVQIETLFDQPFNDIREVRLTDISKRQRKSLLQKSVSNVVDYLRSIGR